MKGWLLELKMAQLTSMLGYKTHGHMRLCRLLGEIHGTPFLDIALADEPTPVLVTN
jgi:hypothetical protein